MKLSSKDHKFRRGKRSVSMINLHFVFVPKRRKAVLVGEIAKRLQEVWFEVAVERQWEVVSLEIMPDHTHLLVNVPPKHSAAQVAGWLKGRAAHDLRAEFPELLKLPSLWSPNYYVGSVGSMSIEVVRKYIEGQTGK